MRRWLVLACLFIVHWQMVSQLDGSAEPMQLTFTKEDDANDFAQLLIKASFYTDISVERACP